MNTYIRLFLIISTLLVFAGCSKNNLPLNKTEELTRIHSGSTSQLEPINLNRQSFSEKNKDTDLEIPAKFRFKRDSYLIKASSWNETLKLMSPQDAAYLTRANLNYFGALSFSDAEELQDLATKGFPLPEEWLEAKLMPDAELKALADSGNLKAKVFYLDRLASQASEYIYLRGVDDSKYQASSGARLSLRAYELATQMQTPYKSPFAGYLLGSVYSRLNYPSTPEAGAGGIFAALTAGDKRALGLMRAYTAEHPDMDVNNVMAAYNALR